MPDDTVHAGRDQRMARLNGNQPAEPRAKHKNWPYPQHAADDEQDHTKPAEAVAVECPESLAVRVSRQIRLQQSKYYQGRDNPAVIAILTLTRTQVDATEDRHDRHQQRYDSHDAQRRM